MARSDTPRGPTRNGVYRRRSTDRVVFRRYIPPTWAPPTVTSSPGWGRGKGRAQAIAQVITSSAAAGRGRGRGTATALVVHTSAAVGRGKGRAQAIAAAIVIAGNTFTREHVFSGADDNAGLGNSFVTASHAFQNDTLYLLSVVTRAGAAAPVTAVSGGGLTWVKVEESPSGGAALDLQVYRGYVTSGASTGALTITTTGTPTAVKWLLDRFGSVDGSGTDGSGAVVQAVAAAGGASGTGSVTLAAFADALHNGAFGVFAHNATEGIFVDPTGGYLYLGDELTVLAPVLGIASEVRVGEDTTVTATWTTSSVTWRAIAIEIRAGTPVARAVRAAGKGFATATSTAIRTGAAHGRGRGRATAVGQRIAAAAGVGRGRGRAQAIASVITTGAAAGRGKGRGTSSASVIVYAGIGGAITAPTFRAVSNTTNTSTIVKPTGTATGDVLIASIFQVNTGTNPGTPTCSTPTGWTLIKQQASGWYDVNVLYGENQLLTVVYRVVQAGDTSWSVTMTAPTTAAIISTERWDGQNATPIGASSSAASFSATGITTADGGDDVLYIGGTSNNWDGITGGWTAPTGYTERVDQVGSVALTQDDKVYSSAGATGTITPAGLPNYDPNGRGVSGVAVLVELNGVGGRSQTVGRGKGRGTASITIIRNGRGHGRGKGRAQAIAAVVHFGTAAGRGKGRAAAVSTVIPASVIVTGAGHGRARGRATAVGLRIPTGAGIGRGHGYATAVGQHTALGSGVGRGRGRATALATVTTTAAAVGRGKGHAQAASTVIQPGTVLGAAYGWARGRAAAIGQHIALAVGSGRGKGRAAALAQVVTTAAAVGRGKGRASVLASPITTAARGHGRARGRAQATGTAIAPGLVLGAAQGRARGRATAVASPVTTTARAQGRARGRGAAAASAIAQGIGTGHARGRATATSSLFRTAAAHGHGKGRSRVLAQPITTTATAHGRARGWTSSRAALLLFAAGHGHARGWSQVGSSTAGPTEQHIDFHGHRDAGLALVGVTDSGIGVAGRSDSGVLVT